MKRCSDFVKVTLCLLLMLALAGCRKNCSYTFRIVNQTDEAIQVEHFFLNSPSLDTSRYTIEPDAEQGLITYGSDEDKKCRDLWEQNALLHIGVVRVYRADTVQSQTDFNQRDVWEFAKVKRKQYRYTAYVTPADF